MQAKREQDTDHSSKDVQSVIDSLKKEVAAERGISIKVRYLTRSCYSSIFDLDFLINSHKPWHIEFTCFCISENNGRK